MSEIRFYHLQYQGEAQAIPQLLAKAFEKGHRIVLKLGSEGDVARMNEHLWTYSPNGFLPHGGQKDGHGADQPIWLTDVDERPNEADVLVLADGVETKMQGDFALCCEMLNGHDPASIANARVRWKAYKEQGFEVTYWQQNERGGWEKKA